jgi:hypothetical protein
VHHVGFIVRIYHDARSSECQIEGECYFAKFEVLVVAFIKIPVDWDFMPCEFVTRYQLFEEPGDCIFNVIR